eukprot:GILK01011939.1.p1 GENE.GILK01011939.1~~GILK01011939.1.p1  ORF type:complete len:220 (-),score=37.14 GILK01011939.1:358-990(-)
MAEDNPWQTSVRKTDLGDMEEIWQLSQKLDNAASSSSMSHSTFSPATGVESYKSLLDVLDEITDISNRCFTAQQDLEIRSDDSKFSDVAGTVELRSKIELLDKFRNHLELILTHKTALVTHLQHPFAGAQIPVEADSQRYLVQALSRMTMDVAHLSSHLDSIRWAASEAAQSSALDQALASLSEAIARHQRLYQTVQNKRLLLQNLNNAS